MDKENGKNNENGSSSKLSNASDSAALLDAASLFGAYWPRGDSNSPGPANLFSAAGGAYGLGPHPSLPFGMLPPTSSRGMASYPAVSSAAAAAYNNVYSNTLSVAASQAASLGIPAASAAWWSMASHLAAQDYLARFQASGMNFPSLGSAADPYSSLGLHSLASHHKSSRSSKSSSSLPKGQSNTNKEKNSSSNSLYSSDKDRSKSPSVTNSKLSYSSSNNKYDNTTLSVLSNMKPPSDSSSGSPGPNDNKSSGKTNDLGYAKDKTKSSSCTSSVKSGSQSVSSIFTSPLSLASNADKVSASASTTQSTVNCSVAALPSSSILSAALEGNSDPNSILGGVRLPPDTEIIKYTSSIIGPKVPGTTNRGRKKTISLDPPLVSVHPTHSSTGMLIERTNKRPKLCETSQDVSLSPSASDKVEVIKLPATNGSPSGLSIPSLSGLYSDSSGEAPLNLSLKPTTTSHTSSSLNSLSNMSANIGVDKISRRKPGPKPRRVIPSSSQSSSSSQLPPGAPSASLVQLFATADSPRPPSRAENSASPSGTCSVTSTASTTIPSIPSMNHKDGRPRNLGRGVSKPKKNTVASLLAQSRALGIKPMPMLDPNASMNQQMSLLKSNILAAQQYIAETGSADEKTLNKYLQEKFKGTVSDTSTIDASTDSDNLTDSNQTDSEIEFETASKKQKQYDENALRVPLELGWKRETIIRGVTKNGGIKGDVTYAAPDSSNKFKQMSDITQYLDHQKSSELSKDNFTFSCRVIIGDYLQPVPPEMVAEAGEYIHLTEDDIIRRLDELKAALKTSLPVEQRIEVARRQQAARAAARLDREQARLARELEKSEKQEAARRDREARSQQLLEGRKRLAFTLEQKMQIISEIEKGKTKSDVSRKLGLASSTVATIWKNRDNIISAYNTENQAQGIDGEGSFCNETGKIKCPSENSIYFSSSLLTAKRKRQEELEKHKQEEHQRKQQERELKKQQTAILKEQMYIQEISKQREMLYTVELERERRRQHMSLIKALENRRKLEERERKKQQMLAEKQANKEKKMEQRRIDMEILTELRKPCEDLELNQTPLPEYSRISGLKLSGKAFADILMVFEFLHNFGETLGFDMESLPTLDSLQQALLPSDTMTEAEEELFSVMTHLIVCAIEDPGIPNPARHTTILGQSLRQADITHANLSEILRIYLYANATGEVKALTGVHFERDKEKRIADHHQNDTEMLQTQSGKNAQFYELLHENNTWKMSDMLKDKPFMALAPSDKAAILAFICNELLQNKAVIRQIEGSLETVSHLKKEKWLLDAKIRKLRMLHNRKVRTEAAEKAQTKLDGDGSEVGMDSPALHKDDLLDDEDNEMSENESVGTQPEEEEDNKLSGEELGKKLEKLVKQSEVQLQALNCSAGQLRATCYGQDRYWRRYWSLPKAGGVFVEGIESAEPELFVEQNNATQESEEKMKSIDDINRVINDADSVNDCNVDSEVNDIVGDKTEEDESKSVCSEQSEQIKTESKSEVFENGEILDKTERSLYELKKSVTRIVESLEKGTTKEESQNGKLFNHIESVKDDDKESVDKKFNLFEKLGQCMERENQKDGDVKSEVKQEVKEELKNEILNELKSETKTEFNKQEIKAEESEDDNKCETDHKWFSILPKDDTTCDSVILTAGNKWDNTIGVCIRENLTELKIPVFPPPNTGSYVSNSCDSPAPLQMTSEESLQIEYIKKHGLPKPCERKSIPTDKRYGWWRIADTDQLKEVLDSLHVRGVRERELKRNFVNIMQCMYERQGKLHIEEGHKDVTELSAAGVEDINFLECGAPTPDAPGSWHQFVAQRVDLFLLEQVEALEDKVANASMQVKGWKIPVREVPSNLDEVVNIAKERLVALEAAIERRYLKPPLGVNTGDPNLAAIAQEASGSAAPAQPIPLPDDIPKGLMVWRDAINRAQTSAQLAMCLYSLEASIAWDKSIMKANCQFCHSGDNEDKLLLCDGCDKGYHTYCFKPKMENIPEGDWYCHECMNKATGERNCIVCGKRQSLTGTKLVLCDLCPRVYHTDCIRPPMSKVPRGKWYCINCIAKKPQKRTVRKNCTKPGRESESSDHPPNSPAASHSSATTNEELNAHQGVNSLNQSDASNSSLANAGSPSSHRKERISKKLLKELAPCKAILEDLECHDDAWPFLLPVNTKQFPTYKKIIKNPMDLSTIKKRLHDVYYKSRDEFCADVRQIFNNCEIFNEDDSPVGKAGHCMRQFFESRWSEICTSHS